MNFYEFASLAKLFLQAGCVDNNFTVTEAELEAASRALKYLGHNRNDWSPQQHDIYDVMVDFIKEYSKGKMNNGME